MLCLQCSGPGERPYGWRPPAPAVLVCAQSTRGQQIARPAGGPPRPVRPPLARGSEVAARVAGPAASSTLAAAGCGSRLLCAGCRRHGGATGGDGAVRSRLHSAHTTTRSTWHTTSSRPRSLSPPTPSSTTHQGTYIDKKCPFVGNVSIRGRILKGIVVSTKMQRTIVIRRDYLQFISKYRCVSERGLANWSTGVYSWVHRPILAPPRASLAAATRRLERLADARKRARITRPSSGMGKSCFHNPPPRAATTTTPVPHFLPRQRHKTISAHASPAFLIKDGDVVTVGQCRPLSKTVRFNVLKVESATEAGAMRARKTFRTVRPQACVPCECLTPRRSTRCVCRGSSRSQPPTKSCSTPHPLQF